MDLKIALRITGCDNVKGCFLTAFSRRDDGVKLGFLKSIEDARKLLDVLLESHGEFKHAFWTIDGRPASKPGEGFVNEGLMYQPFGTLSPISEKFLTQEVLDKFLKILATADDLDEAKKIAKVFNDALAREYTRNNLPVLFSGVDDKGKLLAIGENIEEINALIGSNDNQEATAKMISCMDPATIKAIGTAEEEKLIEEGIGAARKIPRKVIFVMCDYCDEVSNSLFCLLETDDEGAITLNFFENAEQVEELLNILFRDTKLFKHEFFNEDDFVGSRVIDTVIIKGRIYCSSIINEGMIYLPYGTPGEIPNNILTEKALNEFLFALSRAKSFEIAKKIAETFNNLLKEESTLNNLATLLSILETEDGIKKFLLLGKKAKLLSEKIGEKKEEEDSFIEGILSMELEDLKRLLEEEMQNDISDDDDDKEPMIDDSSKEEDDDKEYVFAGNVNLAAEKDSTKSRRGNNSSELAFNTSFVTNEDGSITLVMNGNSKFYDGNGELIFEGLPLEYPLKKFVELTRKKGLEEVVVFMKLENPDFKLKFTGGDGRTVEIGLKEGSKDRLDFGSNKQLEALFKKSIDLSEEGMRKGASASR